jgi:hypothetical protein
MAKDTNWEGMLTHEITDSEEEQDGPPSQAITPSMSAIVFKAS